MEAVKNGFALLGRDSGTLVVDADQDPVIDMDCGGLDQPAGGREADGIVDDVVDGAGETARLAHDDGAFAARPGKGDADVAGLAPRFPTRNDPFDQWPQIDRLEPGTGELGIGSRRLADVVDE